MPSFPSVHNTLFQFRCRLSGIQPKWLTCLCFGKTLHGCLVLLKSFLQVVAREVWLAHVVVDATHVVVVQYWVRLPQVSANTQALIRTRYRFSVMQNKILYFCHDSLIVWWFFLYYIQVRQGWQSTGTEKHAGTSSYRFYLSEHMESPDNSRAPQAVIHFRKVHFYCYFMYLLQIPRWMFT